MYLLVHERVRALLHIAKEGVGENNPPAVRLSSKELHGATDEFSVTISSSFLGLSSTSTEEVLKTYVRDHLRDL